MNFLQLDFDLCGHQLLQIKMFNQCTELVPFHFLEKYKSVHFEWRSNAKYVFRGVIAIS